MMKEIEIDGRRFRLPVLVHKRSLREAVRMGKANVRQAAAQSNNAEGRMQAFLTNKQFVFVAQTLCCECYTLEKDEWLSIADDEVAALAFDDNLGRAVILTMQMLAQ